MKNEAEIRTTLLNEFNLEIGAGLGPLAGKVWRIGLMGYSAQSANVMLCLSALGSVLSDQGLPVKVGEAEGRRRTSRIRRNMRRQPNRRASVR